MLFWLGLLSIITGLVLHFNGVTWFEGEDNVAGIALILGVVLLVLWVVFTAVAVLTYKRQAKRITSRRSFFDV